MLDELKDNKGFTLVELLMVFIVLGIMAQIALVFLLDLRSRSSDIMAISDARNLVTAVRNNFTNLDDVDYTHNPGDGSEIGTVRVDGSARSPVLLLSPGVEVTITGASDPANPGTGLVVATFYHTSGTTDGMTGSGRREFYYVVDELGTDILATF